MTTVVRRVGSEVTGRRMRRLLSRLPPFLLVGAGLAAPPHSSFAVESRARVIRVIDGDTVEVSVDGQLERVRLIGVDALESRDKRLDSRVAAAQAQAFAAQLALDREVTLAIDPRSSDRDRYGRLLRYIYLPDGRLLNAELISSGHATALRGFPYAREREFLELEKRAGMPTQPSEPNRDAIASARVASAVVTTLVATLPGVAAAQTQTAFSPIVLTRAENSLRALLDGSAVAMFLAGLLLPFALPLIMSARGRGWRWCLGVTRRCIWPWVFLTVLVLLLWALVFFSVWLQPLLGGLGIAPEYFLERGQIFTYQGLPFGIGKSAPLKNHPVLPLAYLLTALTAGTSLALLTYKLWARSAAPLAYALRTAGEKRKGIHERA